MLITFQKAPDDVLDYDIDFSRWLTDGDTIQSSSAVIVGDAEIGSVSNTGTVAKVWISGGTDGVSSTVTVTVVTVIGRQKEQTIRLKIKDN